MAATETAPSGPFTPEIVYTDSTRCICDGAVGISPALGHPRVYLQIDEHGYVDCGYCDRRFVLRGGPADGADHSKLPDHPAGASI
jgi:NADH dehydrogenase (ubiquinone) Fe-S protein 6